MDLRSLCTYRYPMHLHILRPLVVTCLLITTSAVFGQLSFGGRPAGLDLDASALLSVPCHTFPAVDAARLLAEDAQQLAEGIKGPHRFGVNHATDLGLDNSGVWSGPEDGMRIWRLRLRCPGALNMNLAFREFILPEGARVFVHNTTGQWLGAFTQASSSGHPEMGVDLLAGEELCVEYQEPVAVAGQGRLRIGRVTHGYRSAGLDARDLNDSGPCNNNTICPEGDEWQPEISSVAMIVVNGSGLCTGQLINNCANNGTPYFLTANHCLSGSPANWVFRFNWESPTCTPTTNGPTNQSISGASLLTSNANSDVALLQLSSTPPASYNVYYSGWDATGEAPNTSTCIHHPSGDIKKITFDTDAPGQSTFLGAQCWHIFDWDDGTTETGSSGSGLWNPDHRLIGQLYGGEASCSNNVNDHFGRFDLSYPLLTGWLGDCGPVLDGYDPNAVPVALDAQVLSITGVPGTLCDANVVSPVIVLRNGGTSTLTSIAWSISLDGGTPVTGLWTGTLPPNTNTPVPVPAFDVLNGPHTLVATCSAPNGGTDQNTANDNRTRTFNALFPATTATLRITLDSWGSETTWTLAPEGGGTIRQGGPYSDGQSGTVVNETLCLRTGCYTLTMNDSYGDGICCAEGDGDFEVLDENGDVVLNGDGAFLFSTSSTFCVEATGIVEQDVTAFTLHPVPSDGRFTLVRSEAGEAGILNIRDAAGRLVRTERITGRSVVLDLGGADTGVYSVELVAGDRRSVRRISIVR